MPELHLHTWWDPDHFTMALTFNNDHIIYYHMDDMWPVGFGALFCSSLLFGQVMLVHTTYLSPDTVNQMGPQIYCIVKFFLGREGYTPLGAPCDCIMAIIDHSSATMPFVITAFLTMNRPY